MEAETETEAAIAARRRLSPLDPQKIRVENVILAFIMMISRTIESKKAVTRENQSAASDAAVAAA